MEIKGAGGKTVANSVIPDQRGQVGPNQAVRLAQIWQLGWHNQALGRKPKSARFHRECRGGGSGPELKLARCPIVFRRRTTPNHDAVFSALITPACTTALPNHQNAGCGCVGLGRDEGGQARFVFGGAVA